VLIETVLASPSPSVWSNVHRSVV